jgi:outer membrane protein OmpA-like peptidoglycan-associated protein
MDTAVSLPGRGLYVFNGDQVWRYTGGRTLDLGYPKPITNEFPGAFQRNLDAALLHPDGSLYLFRGNQHLRFNLAAGRPELGYPRPYAPDWPGVFPDRIDAAITWAPDIIYLFRGDAYTSFSPRQERARPGYPKLIHGNWPGIRHGPVRSTFTLPDKGTVFLADAPYLVDAEGNSWTTRPESTVNTTFDRPRSMTRSNAVTEFNSPWQPSEPVLASTELFDEKHFHSPPFGAGSNTAFTAMPDGVPRDELVPGHGRGPAIRADEASADLSSYIAPISLHGEGETATTLEVDPAALGEPWAEQQVPSLVAPTTNSVFPPDAMPDELQARPLVQLTARVPTERVLAFIVNGRGNLEADGGWSDRLQVDLVYLPKAAPTTTVHVFVVKTVPFDVHQNPNLAAFRRFARRMNHVQEPVFDNLTVADYKLNRAIEEQFSWPPASIAAAARLATIMTDEEAANYKIVIDSVLPDSVRGVVMPPGLRSLTGFAFDKSTLTAEHERTLGQVAWEVAHSWYSRRMVIRIGVDGHTDPVGTAVYNKALGLRRAQAVTERLKQLVKQKAGRLPAGTVERIEYAVRSFGEERPISRLVQALNRRVEITLFRDTTPAPTPLDLQLTVSRLDGLLAASSLDPDAVTRMRCVLKRARDPDFDDRFLNETQVFYVSRNNAMPGPTEWSRVRNLLQHPDLFGPALSDDQVLTNIGQMIDQDIIYGVRKMNQMVDYAGGPDNALGLVALPRAFKEFNIWVLARLDDPKSVYTCYPMLHP